MAAITVKRNGYFSRLKPLFSLQRLYHKFVKSGQPKGRLRSENDYDVIFKPGEINVSKWEKMDSRSLGITRMMVPFPPSVVLRNLQTRGFEAYLVGGCVRDLLLKKTPKDFDVITTANLRQIKKQFHRCEIVGRRYPICRVHIKDSVIEVSSFNTVAKHSEGKEKVLLSQMPNGCDKSDLNLWKNSMHRDFTVNSLFFDPLVHKIYDYNSGMKDLFDLKLRTLVPANISFTEDCARILRGLRIAARLNLSFSKDIEKAIHKHAKSVFDLDKTRILMEVNYMLSLGAAESSLRLLNKFHILEILLPFQAAYISQQATRSAQSSMMLMKLFSHLDNMVTCDHPSGRSLWIGLLAFHMALVKNPQHPFVVLTFASVLYHQEWEKGLQYARKCGRSPISFEPEFLEPYDVIPDIELSEKVHQLALQVKNSVDILVEKASLQKAMSKFPDFPFSSLVFVSKKAGSNAAQLFNALVHQVETYKKEITSFEMNYELLQKEDASATRFALGKIILNTIGCGVDQDGQTSEDDHHLPSCAENGHAMDTKMDKKRPLSTSNLKSQHKKQKLIAEFSNRSKKQNAVTDKNMEVIADAYLLEQEKQEEFVSTEHTKSPDHKNEDHATEKPEQQKLILTLESIVGYEKSSSELDSQKEEERFNVDTKVKVDQLIAEEEQRVNKDVKPKKKNVLPLSALFK